MVFEFTILATEVNTKTQVTNELPLTVIVKGFDNKEGTWNVEDEPEKDQEVSDAEEVVKEKKRPDGEKRPKPGMKGKIKPAGKDTTQKQLKTKLLD